MNILVTGGTGFIGSALCRHLVAAGEKVLTVDQLTPDKDVTSLSSIEMSPNYRFVDVDLYNDAALYYLMQDAGIECVIHNGSESAGATSLDDPAQLVDAHVASSGHVLTASLAYWRSLGTRDKQRFRFHHVSNQRIFDCLAGVDEALPGNTPLDRAARAAADSLVHAFHQTYGLPTVISFCSIDFGPFQRPDELVPMAILNALAERPLRICGQGSAVREWIYVCDHARAMDVIIKTGTVGEIYSVNSHCQRSVIEIVQTICDILDLAHPRHGARSYRDLITFAPSRDENDHDNKIDTLGTKPTELDWSPEESLESGLMKTVEWFVENNWWWEPMLKKNNAAERHDPFPG